MSQRLAPEGQDYTFWGKGRISQGHSDAIRRVCRCKNGKQYTIPVEERFRGGSVQAKNPELSTREKHTRECFRRTGKKGESAKIEERDRETMPNYFADYDTRYILSRRRNLRKRSCWASHGGFVFRTGVTRAWKETVALQSNIV